MKSTRCVITRIQNLTVEGTAQKGLMFILQHGINTWTDWYTHTDKLFKQDYCLFKDICYTHTRLCPFSQTTRVSRYQKGKPFWILLKQETVSGSGISWATCKSASRSRQITMPVPHHSKVFYRPDALPATQPTASKH